MDKIARKRLKILKNFELINFFIDIKSSKINGLPIIFQI